MGHTISILQATVVEMFVLQQTWPRVVVAEIRIITAEEALLCDHSHFLRQCRLAIAPFHHYYSQIANLSVLFLAPHIGHLYTMVIADVLKRWQLLLGETGAQLLTGTDEHGMKVEWLRL